MSITLKQACVEINGKNLLNKVSVELNPSELVCIVGENGAGKTTLLNALAGAIELSSGELAIDSQPVNSYTPMQLAAIRAVLPQNSDLGFPLSAIEVVRMALSLAHYPSEKQQELLNQSLALFDAQHLAEQNFLTLSGGEKQRVQLARVIAQLSAHQSQAKKQFLLLDEPISALDLNQQYKTLASLKSLSQQGLGIMAIVHDLNLASMYSDRIIMLKNGAIYQQGSPLQTLTETNLEQAFAVNVNIHSHPDTQTPFIIPRAL